MSKTQNILSWLFRTKDDPTTTHRVHTGMRENTAARDEEDGADANLGRLPAGRLHGAVLLVPSLRSVVSQKLAPAKVFRHSWGNKNILITSLRKEKRVPRV